MFAGEVVEDAGSGVRVTVRVADETLTIDGDDAVLSVGDRVTFCVRPEELDVVAADEASDATGTGAIDEGPNALAATVTSAEFLGETPRVHLEWQGRELLVRARDPLSGDVTVRFDPGDAWIVDVE